MSVVYIDWGKLATLLLMVASLIIYNEFLVYYIVILQCTWPVLDSTQEDALVGKSNYEPLRVMFLADTHLLGSRGHWLDKLRREWQMERSFQSSMLIHNPEIIFVLGDLFDEGKWSSDVEFQGYVNNFHRIFRHPSDTDLQVVVGNHDIGFHYMVSEEKRRRFNSAFQTEGVRLLTIKDVNFVLVNSVAMEGDNCDMCHAATVKLREIEDILSCAEDSKMNTCDAVKKVPDSRSILLQHYPLFRQSDEECVGPDVAPPGEKEKSFREKWDCISKKSTEDLLDALKPRLVVSGHTHYGCYRVHRENIPEWSVPSFNWRNINNPSFLLAVISNNNYALKKCYLPQETTVTTTYTIGVFIILVWLLAPRKFISQFFSRPPRKTV